MSSVLAVSAVDCWLESWWGPTRDIYNRIYCYSVRSKSKDGLAQNQNNVSEWNNMSTRRMLFQLAL